MNLNGKQIIGIGVAVLGVLMVSTAQLTDLFGANTAKNIVSGAAILNSILGGIIAQIGGASSEISNTRQLGLMGNPDAQRALIGATEDIAHSGGDGIGQFAADALISATIGLPQVQTIVTDSATAQSSPSNDVRSSEQVSVVENASGQTVQKGG